MFDWRLGCLCLVMLAGLLMRFGKPEDDYAQLGCKQHRQCPTPVDLVAMQSKLEDNIKTVEELMRRFEAVTARLEARGTK